MHGRPRSRGGAFSFGALPCGRHIHWLGALRELGATLSDFEGRSRLGELRRHPRCCVLHMIGGMPDVGEEASKLAADAAGIDSVASSGFVAAWLEACGRLGIWREPVKLGIARREVVDSAGPGALGPFWGADLAPARHNQWTPAHETPLALHRAMPRVLTLVQM